MASGRPRVVFCKVGSVMDPDLPVTVPSLDTWSVIDHGSDIESLLTDFPHHCDSDNPNMRHTLPWPQQT